jgi:hypothetical protein
MDTYKVGNTLDQIKLEVDISTFGLAASRAILVDLNSPAPGISVASSQDATGDIGKTEIGKAKNIKNRRLSIFTKIDLLGDDVAARKLESENLTGKYTLDGGPNGSEVFGTPIKTVDDEFLTVFLHKPIDLIV